ncbi:hypothetical protein CEP51_010363 [Fusarium floridanum]|uniref:Uncharacterized protein n=1 Tax=Fusarium floridanum TaxID=1325733 RepID=A0A428REM6_9HYPO|nr:hypothetical protein CEP51_010363 [Fusarium floridanum]
MHIIKVASNMTVYDSSTPVLSSDRLLMMVRQGHITLFDLAFPVLKPIVTNNNVRPSLALECKRACYLNGKCS